MHMGKYGVICPNMWPLSRSSEHWQGVIFFSSQTQQCKLFQQPVIMGLQQESILNLYNGLVRRTVYKVMEDHINTFPIVGSQKRTYTRLRRQSPSWWGRLSCCTCLWQQGHEAAWLHLRDHKAESLDCKKGCLPAVPLPPVRAHLLEVSSTASLSMPSSG